ncbi:DUF1990 family protein [Lentzea sp. HUAS12]|uniref:DUF1990 family protein n=1 Tax=Lentzea sp. HUAS12 TaxID=2951806 RepID=UPI0020A0EA73|nr:DUF1990 family protein [Lentzea sp. HUAS12]USX54746.1 DUF1990 domain-containing protein [Lentzea sp. HUAS12]
MRIMRASELPVHDVITDLRARSVNYDPDEIRGSAWHFDHHRFVLGTDPPGRPQEDSVWWHAYKEVAAYAFTPAGLLRAHYRREAPLLGKDLLLVGRFAPARFVMGVRITETGFDEDGVRYSWGWSYETLQGHIERGRVDYRVVKDLESGVVTLEVNSYNQVNPRAHPLIRLGWFFFGRRAQHRFYTSVGENLRRLARQPRVTDARTGDEDVVEVPRDAGCGREPFWAIAVLDGARDPDPAHIGPWPGRPR